jgi:isocitrate dehydrogenase (NAD+)
MLDYLHLNEPAARIRQAVRQVIGEGKIVTPDLGGHSTTQEYTSALLSELGHKPCHVRKDFFQRSPLESP